MKREKNQKRRKTRRSFGSLLVSVKAGNTESWLRDSCDRFVAEIARKRREKGYEPDANVAV
jgi:hypothetical protein